jgi:hypothetical protein
MSVMPACLEAWTSNVVAVRVSVAVGRVRSCCLTMKQGARRPHPAAIEGPSVTGSAVLARDGDAIGQEARASEVDAQKERPRKLNAGTREKVAP